VTIIFKGANKAVSRNEHHGFSWRKRLPSAHRFIFLSRAGQITFFVRTESLLHNRQLPSPSTNQFKSIPLITNSFFLKNCLKDNHPQIQLYQRHSTKFIQNGQVILLWTRLEMHQHYSLFSCRYAWESQFWPSRCTYGNGSSIPCSFQQIHEIQSQESELVE
jgi:hypothetical protein